MLGAENTAAHGPFGPCAAGASWAVEPYFFLTTTDEDAFVCSVLVAFTTAR